MSKSVRQAPTSTAPATSAKDPLQPVDFFSQFDSAPNTFGNVTTKEINRTLPAFKPEDTPSITNPTPYDDPNTLDNIDAAKQPYSIQTMAGLNQLMAGAVSGFGQALANSTDLASWGNDSYQSHLFGMSTKDMQDWNNSVQQRNHINRGDDEGNFNPGSYAWWMEQVGSSGTGIGMGAYSALETGAVELATGGIGTGAAISKLGDLFSSIRKARGLDEAVEAASTIKDMRSAATAYGVLSRTNESRMEAMQSYDDTKNTMAQMKNPDGSQKYTDAQLNDYAHAAANKTFGANMALLPLDILAYRTMIFNPISGSSEGLIEETLGKISNKALRKATQYGTEAFIEGSEEGYQNTVQDEAKHYAQVVGGNDDGTSFLQRMGKEITGDDFWNNFAGGVIGAPIIGGTMNLANKVIYGNRTAKLNALHNYYVQNIGKMDNAIADKIRAFQVAGDYKKADIERRQFRADKALSALELDARSDKTSAFDAHVTFLQGMLDEVNQGKTDAFGDLGFENPTQEQVDYIKKSFQSSIDDATEMKSIYDNVKNKYNRNFVSEITQQHFYLNSLLKEQQGATQNVMAQQAKLNQFDQLTPQGKEQYNAEYNLASLMHEQSRLNDQYRNSDHPLEKENVNQLIDINKKKITDIRDRLNEIGKDVTYQSGERSNDKDILDSALRDKNYQLAIHEKNHLDNEIALQRKNLALWNNKQYMKSKNEESIKKAKTVQQVENTKEDLTQKGEIDKDMQDKLDDKTSEIAAKQAASVMAQQADPENDPNNSAAVVGTGGMGNQSLFEEDNNLINSVAQASAGKSTTPPARASNKQAIDNESQNPEEAEFLLDPAKYDYDNSPEPAKQQVIKGVKGLHDRLEGKPDFEKLVRHVAKVQGLENADKIFNALKWGWQQNNFQADDYTAIYNKIFNNPFEDLEAGINGLVIETPGQLTQAILEHTGAVIATNKPAEAFDNNGQPVYDYSGFVTNESSPKFAYATRLSQLLTQVNEDGSIQVSHEYTTDELGTSQYIDSLPLLDPDKFGPGAEMVARVPDNFNDITIPIYNNDGTKSKTMTFGAYVASKGLDVNSQEYQDKLPIIIHRKNASSDEKGVAFVHDIGWYHPLRFNQQFKGDMEQAIKSTREIRNEVMSKNGVVPLIITAKRETTFDGLKTGKDASTLITLREANPQTRIMTAFNDNSLSIGKGESSIAFPNNKTVMANVKPFIENSIYDVRRYGTKDGKQSFMAFPVFNPTLDEGSKSSVLQAINIYANRTNTDKDVRSKHDQIQKTIQSNMGLDIMDARGLEQYLQHFITTFNTEKASTNQDVEAQAKAKLKPGTPFISFIAGGNIVFGKAGQPVYTDSSSGKAVGSYFINPNTVGKAGIALKGLMRPDIIGWYRQNVNFENLNRNKPVMTIDKSLNTSMSAKTYNDYLLDRIQTNVRSHNIGTEDNPNYVTNIQPIITYDLKSKLEANQKPVTNEQVAAEIAPAAIPVNKEDSTAKSLMNDFLSDAKKDLGSDFGKGKESDLFSPPVLNEKQRDTVGKSIQRIAGLNPKEQEDIVKFMYNQVTGLVNFDNNIVTKAEVDKHINDTFKEVINPLVDSYKDKIAYGEKLMQEHPETKSSEIPDAISSYKYRLQKISDVVKSMDVLRDEAYQMVKKYTGITENKQRTEQGHDEEVNTENPDNKVEDEPNDRERDFWTDILQENPESRLSYSMRRFFDNIREYDKNGQAKTGFLGLPTYEGPDTIARTLMVTLADIPSSFDTMINRLEDRKASIPWMEQTINKLKGATKQQKAQFVTVMSNTSLRMKFMMLSYNPRTKSYNTKVYDTHLNGVAEAVKDRWASDFKMSQLVLPDEEGNYILNDKRAKALINRFDSWRGATLSDVGFDMNAYRQSVDQVKSGKPSIFSPKGADLSWLKNNLPNNSSRVKFSIAGREYQISRGEDSGKFEIKFLDKSTATREEVTGWLHEFGINLSHQSMDELLLKGLFHNYQQRKYSDLFQSGADTNGLFGILANTLRVLVEKPGTNITEEGNIIMDNSVIKSLANLESKYNTEDTPFGFRDNGKSYFALTAPKFITDRVRDLKTLDSTVSKQLRSVSFSSESLWLKLLTDSRCLDKFNVSHIGANAFKEYGKRLYKDNSISKLADVDHERTKLGMFWDTTQGEVPYNNGRYPGTDVMMRTSTMFSPTMSDKHIMTLITTGVLNLRNADLNNGTSISEHVNKILYEQTIKPELKRMIRFWQNGGETNIKLYDKGAGMFLLMPAMNHLEIAPGLKLVDAIKHQPNSFTLDRIEANDNFQKASKELINKYIDNLVTEKLGVWEKSGITSGGKIDVIDRKYMDRFRGTPEEKTRMTAMDYVINSLVSSANSFMTMAGDPAMYYKSSSSDPIQAAKETFINVGKRLANQIAPGTTISNSENEKYLQLFLKDRESISENIGYLERLYGKDSDIVKSYKKIEASDAQEYTTWKEHLDILERLGKTPDSISDISNDEIQEARDIFSEGKPLTDKQRKLVTKVLQPIKPVYTGQIFDGKQDAMRTVYIKSSSFPLIPQMTEGFEIDKLRVAMEKLQGEKLQDGNKLNVRASYQSANKVGALNNALSLWNEDGKINEEELKNAQAYSLPLDRKNFRIQQEVPYKAGKTGDNKITLGTQIMKLLFGDEMLNYGGFTYNGKIHTGKELHNIYNQSFIRLVQEKRSQLYNELGLDDNGTPTDYNKSMTKLQDLLKTEAQKRGYPLQDIEGLQLTKDGRFNMPLWSSSNSNRYESMLNSIVSNRLIRIKFPGTSSVTGSEEGFIKQENFKGVDKSRIIYTNAWNGSHLSAVNNVDGQLKKAQVFVASKFKDNQGNLIDLFQRENGEYKYITKTDDGYKLNHSMFDSELLSGTSFRIPTSGHQSASEVEIAGFLPAENADLMIVPRNFTKQKGLDFDIDKENMYNLWTRVDKSGKIKVLDESHRTEMLAEADRELQRAKTDKSPEGKLSMAIFGNNEDQEYSDEEVAGDKYLTNANSVLNERLLQNEIIKIHSSVMSNPSDEVQRTINKTLNTDYAEQQANFIENLGNSNTDSTYWTALSDEYQKQKLIMGASGKIGTGAYSLDVVFHSLAQQLALQGKPISLVDISDEGSTMKQWRFGNLISDGLLGGTKTLDGSRSIADVNIERQNISLDNEKLQVMGRVNINDITMDVDKVFNLMGFDKGSDGNSISFLFMSQPIIKDFVDELKNANSNLAGYSEDKEGDAFDKLLSKYETDPQEINEAYWDKMSHNMTNQNMITAIKSSKPDGNLQAAILRRFMEMRKYGLAIRNIQTTINTDSKGLGKSFFDIIEKRNSLNRLGTNSDGIIQGASELIGDYVANASLTSEQRDGLKEAGYIDIGENMVKPTTLSGGFNVMGVSTAYNTWSKHFPYDASVTQSAFREILSTIGQEGMGDTRTVEMKQEIFRGMKKYFSASKLNGIISPSDNINEERRRLYIDSKDNMSLARYLSILKNTSGNPVVDTYIKTNKLINRLEFDLNKNGTPSLIKFNNATGEEFDEQYLYQSLATLLENREKVKSLPLPDDIGNKKYTLDTLAQDMIAYAYLGNATQEAIQFTKYVPISYLDQVGYANIMRNVGTWLDSDARVLGMKMGQSEKEAHLVGEFTMQYIQHNPDRVQSKFNEDKLKSLVNRAKDNTFTFKDGRTPSFVSVYNPSASKGEKKFNLYHYDGVKYYKIPVLGTFGMDEYQPRNYVGQSLINSRVKDNATPQVQITNTAEPTDNIPLFSIESGDSYKIMNSIASGSTRLTDLAKQLAPYSEGVKKIVVSDTLDRNGKIYSSFNGHYDSATDTITIHSSIVKDSETLARTFVHEIVHKLTVNAIKPFITTNIEGGAELNSMKAPQHVQDMVRLYNSVRLNSDSDMIKEIKSKLGMQALTDEEKANYGYSSIYEFMANALTNKPFQDILSKIDYKQTGSSILQKFKDIIGRVLEAIGITYDEKFTLAHAVDAVFNTIEKSNFKINENPFEGMWDDVNNEGDPEETFNPRINDRASKVTEYIKTLPQNKIRC